MKNSEYQALVLTALGEAINLLGVIAGLAGPYKGIGSEYLRVVDALRTAAMKEGFKSED
ncbi:MAG TPA: hypothetical protein VF238_11070 [Methylomirabilota bacterium]